MGMRVYALQCYAGIFCWALSARSTGPLVYVKYQPVGPQTIIVMPPLDEDSKAILDAIISTSENPLADILANMSGGKSSATFTVGTKRSRSDSDSSGRIPSFRQFMEAMSSSKPDEPKAGPSSKPEAEGSEGKEGEPEESEKKPETLVERVKRQKLDHYERSFLESIVDTDHIATDFGSVHLPEDIVDTLRSLVSLPLLCPEEFQCGILKQHTMSGALLFGPPGTGKTLFAQALAKESGANMISVKPSDIMDKCVGESEKLVRGLFKLARRLHPCIVFIDELDALFGARTHAGQQSSARWHTSMLTEFMQEMDGLMTSKVVVIGATNRPFDLDDAVLRRLPCRVLIDLPDKFARQEILKILLREEALAADVKLDALADRTDRFSGSDLKNLCLAAAFNAVKDNVTVPWKTGSKKGKERAPGESTFVRPSNKPYANIVPVSESTGASIVEVTDSVADATSTSDAASDSVPSTLKPTPTSTETSTEASSVPSPAEPAPSPESEPARTKSPFVTSRLLANKHFTHALDQVGPSSSDTQSTLGEIRTWNAKFGSGGNKTAGIPGLGYGGRPGGLPFTPSSTGYTPSSTGTGIPGLGARPGGSSLFGGSGSGTGIPGLSGSGSGIPGISGSGSGIPGITGSGSGMGVPGLSGGGAGTGIPAYGASGTGTYGGSGAGMGGSGMGGSGMGGSGMGGSGMGGSGMGGSGMGGSGMGGSGMGFPSSTGTSLPGITGTGLGTGLPRFDPAGGRENMSRFDHGGAGGNSMGYTGPGGSGAGTGISTYGGGGGGLNFGGGMRPGGGGRDMPWHQRPGSGLGLGSDDLDMASIAAAARKMGMGGGAGMGLSGEGGLGKAVDA